MGYRIGSFNIQKFSRNAVHHSKNIDSKKDLDYLAKIIRENNFDIIAIQEIFHPLALKELLEALSGQYAVEEQLRRGSVSFGSNNIGSRTVDSFGYRTKHWEGRWTKPRSAYGDQIAEGYAFLWNRDRINLVTNTMGKAFEPRIADFGGVEKLVRPPMIGRFMPINGRYEFRLINTHIIYGKPAKNNEETEENNVNTSDVLLRQKEFETLIHGVYTDYNDMVFDKTGHDKNARNLVAYTFLLGDYNLNLGPAGKSNARFTPEMRYIHINSRNPMCIVTVNEKLTTLCGIPQDEEKKRMLQMDLVAEHHLANNYDHFSYDRNKFVQHQIAQPIDGVIHAFQLYQDTEEETKYDIYRRRISDHIPIYIDVDVRKRN